MKVIKKSQAGFTLRRCSGFTLRRCSGFTLRRCSGFTLAEMMIMLVIFTIIFTLALVNFRRGERLESFRLATLSVASYLRQAQTATLTGLGTGVSMSQAYGLYFNLGTPTLYLFFKDDNNNHLYDAIDEIVETITLPEEITLTALVSDNPLHIVFEPPKPTIYISDGVNTYQTAEIRLARQYFPNKQGVISLNGITGQVSAELIDVP